MYAQKIPKKFAKKFGDDLSDFVTLVVPNGYRWVLELKRHGRSLWFEDGWHEFISHHCIQVGQLLVFRFEGNSVFNFYMFNLTSISNGSCITSNASCEQSPIALGKEAECEKLVELFGYSSPDPSHSSAKKAFCESSEQQKFHGSSNEASTSSAKKAFCESSEQQKFHGSSNEASTKNFTHWFDTQNLHPPKDFDYTLKGLDKLQVLRSNGDIGIQFNGDGLAKARENLSFQFSNEIEEGARKKKLKVEPSKFYKCTQFN